MLSLTNIWFISTFCRGNLIKSPVLWGTKDKRWLALKTHTHDRQAKLPQNSGREDFGVVDAPEVLRSCLAPGTRWNLLQTKPYAMSNTFIEKT